MTHSVRLGLLPVAVVEDRPARDGTCILEMGYRRRRAVPVMSGPLAPELFRSCRCDLLVVAEPSLLPEELAATADVATRAGLSIAFLSGMELQEQHWTQSIGIDGF